MDLGIPASHLVMGLPWYGITYKYIAGVPFNQGTVQYGDVPHLLKNHTEWKPRLIENDLTWRVDCGGPCTEGNDGTEMWYDTPETYTAKYSLARKYGLGVRLGVGSVAGTAASSACWRRALRRSRAGLRLFSCSSPCLTCDSAPASTLHDRAWACGRQTRWTTTTLLVRRRSGRPSTAVSTTRTSVPGPRPGRAASFAPAANVARSC